MKNILKIFKSIIAFLVFIALLFCGMNFFSDLMVPKDEPTAEIIRGLYKQEKDSIDVLVLGDSSTYRSINPAIFWEDSQLTSYVVGASAARIQTLYYLLEEALKKQTPKLVVVETNCLFNKRKYSLGNRRKVVDNMKLSKNKLNMINDEVFHFTKRQKLSMLFPVSLYHNRYNEITKDDVISTIKGVDSEYNGFVMNTKRKPAKKNPNYMNKVSNDVLDETSKTYLNKIEELCKERNVPLMYLKVPGIREWNKTKNELMMNYTMEKGIPYFDMNFNMANPIDWSVDTMDKGVHLNTYGAYKATQELSMYIRNHYHIHSTKKDMVEKRFNDMLNKYYETLYNN